MSNDNIERLQRLASQTLQYCMERLQTGDDGLLRYVDTIDEREISAHYGATHAATAFVVYGLRNGDTTIYKKGVDLLRSILQRWDDSQTLTAFHYDFNNFALCVAYDHLPEQDLQLKEQIKSTILRTADSNHDTVNWLPMRWYVNNLRWKWTENELYKKRCEECAAIVRKATNGDGSIEDRLPQGKSYNLQYNAATVGCLQFLRNHGIDYPLDNELGFLLQSVLPDGDINYQGRGTNQIFAWSLWLYLLATSGNDDALTEALNYVEERIPVMLAHHNLMLNDYDGEEKYLWWDYHYSSVYIAHLLFWMVLALQDQQGKTITPHFIPQKEQNLQIVKKNDYAVALFGGREEYLSEQGPVVAAIWTKRHGVLMKGTFGPYKGLFGNQYTFDHIVLQNYCGLLQVMSPKDWTKNRYFRKLFPTWKPVAKVQLAPIFVPVSVVEQEGCLHIKFCNDSVVKGMFNIPILADTHESEITLWVDGKEVKLFATSRIRSQYGWCTLLQSKMLQGHAWELRIK